jgi:hypothetical protein
LGYGQGPIKLVTVKTHHVTNFCVEFMDGYWCVKVKVKVSASAQGTQVVGAEV